MFGVLRACPMCWGNYFVETVESAKPILKVAIFTRFCIMGSGFINWGDITIKTRAVLV